MDPEVAHHVAVRALRMMPVSSILQDLDLSRVALQQAHFRVAHPIGLAAGFDKHAEIFHRLGNLGFSWVEVGAITPRAQPGNAKPRVFRLPEDQAIINRYGFNSCGKKRACINLLRHPKTCVLGINLGRNKDSTHPWWDFVEGARDLHDLADYLTLNVSSPNTPGLRALQQGNELQEMICQMRLHLPKSYPLWVKLAPDMPEREEINLIDALCDADIQALILSNTTTRRPESLQNKHVQQTGGLSGVPLRPYAEAMLKRVAGKQRQRFTLIASGGVMNGDDVYARLQMGAHAVQIYTALIYHGPFVLRSMLERLLFLMDCDGVRYLSEIYK